MMAEYKLIPDITCGQAPSSFDYEVVMAGHPVTLYGKTYVPERTCTCKCKKSGKRYVVWDFSCCGEYCENIEDSGATELQLDVCPQCGAKAVMAE